MIIVTGGAGFIGSNIVKGLNDKGYDKIIVVDNLSNAEKFKNLLALKYIDYLSREDFIKKVQDGFFDNENIEAIFHQGACSNTMETDGKYMMDNNYEYTKKLINFSVKKKFSLLYASSASVYGNGDNGFSEKLECEKPLNVYAFSKYSIDQYVRKLLPSINNQIVGLRYFNVFGPQENHKGRMASVAYHFYHQLKEKGEVSLFEGVDGYENGEQKRDFVYVKDVVKVNLFFFENRNKRGVFNCGTGNARSFNDVAKALIQTKGKGKISYVEFPEKLKGKYQNFTEANLLKLREAGYCENFISLEDAIRDYCCYLDCNNGYLK